MPPELEVTMKEVAGQTASLTWGHAVARTPSLIKAMLMMIRKRRRREWVIITIIIIGNKRHEFIICLLYDKDEI